MNERDRPIRLFQFPRMFDIPNLSPFCCKLETWLRIAGIPYVVEDTRNPRKGPRGKLPFIDDDGQVVADTTIIIDHLKRTRGIDPDAGLDPSQRATALLVQRTLEEHYAFVLAYTHLIRDEGRRHTEGRFDALPSFMRPLVSGLVRKQVAKILWFQGLSRNTHEEIVEAALRDWRAVLAMMSSGPFFFGAEPSSIDATVFATLASTVLTPIDTPIRTYLRSQPGCLDYAERMRSRYFPELSAAPAMALSA
ncbi:glutathione S-transferase family protein [Bradyrhizobium sp. 177]|uniref:glutathione S-transferase family protein n=1 Tax=Bradyrhizobium sp. 177 TaxID=2782647 RepID=UPI001FF9CDE6|nr:glutathione S-transferase family protein [Bradyrhizobium sp. 177]MCK1553704.1 glutathione S-transferase family protein [Bradyrhizobium sp. 177]